MQTTPRFAMLFVLLLAVLAVQCSPPQKDNRAADEAAIKAADEAWSRSAETNQLDGPGGFNSFFTDDVRILGPNEPMTSGKDAAREAMAKMFALPGFALKWTVTSTTAAMSGELGYSMGTYEFTMNGPDGSPMPDRGKYMTIWRKQADGSWKVAVDMFNSDLPLPGSPSM